MERPAQKSVEEELEGMREVVSEVVKKVNKIVDKLGLGVETEPKCPPFPEFEKGNLEHWLEKVDHFFTIESLRDEESKIKLASYHLDPEAYGWHKKIIAKHRGYNLTWPDYVSSLKQLSEEASEPPMIRLMRLRQQPDTPVKEFNQEFNSIVGRIRLNSTNILEAYLALLDRSISLAVKKHRPTTFEQAQKIALSVELSRARGQAL